MPLGEVIFPQPGAYDFRVTMKGQTFSGTSLYLVESDEAPAAS
jgi:hypothetical protein